MTARRAILALDQGTTSSRAIVLSVEPESFGEPLGEGRRDLACRFPEPGRVEQDPSEIWRTQRECAEEALGASRDAARVLGIGITNQRETVMLWDRASGEPIAPAIVWQDRRTADRTERLRDEGREAAIRAKTGLVCDPYFSASKVEWLLDHVPGARSRAERGELAMGTVDTWLLWNLTEGRVHATDPSNASRTQLWNLERQSWDDDLLELFRVPRAVLPTVVASAGECGRCRLLGGDLPVLSIVGDQQAALAGQLCSEPGESKTTYGTGCFLLVQSGEKRISSDARLLTTAAWRIGESATRWALEGSVFMGGALIQWLRDGLGVIREAPEVGPLAASVEDSAGVTLVPSFTGLGAPHWDPRARGTVLGLTRGTTRAHLARAALEGIAHQVADVIEAAGRDLSAAGAHEVSRVRADGGAAACDELLQIQADLLGLPVERPDRLETTALGAASLAAIAAGAAPDLEALRSSRKVAQRFEPRRDEGWRRSRRSRWGEAVELATRWGDR
ncbi:MAG: glycerol kinase GlpK [Phycisphaerales bacterium]|jgi:glycerol kinase